MRWFLTAVIALGACDRCTREDPAFQERVVDAGLAARIDPPEAERLDALARPVLAERMGELEGAPGALAWSEPSCSLQYALRSAYLAEVAEGREPAGKEVLATIAVNPGEGGVTLQLTAAKSTLLAEGGRTPRAHEALRWAPTLVTTDGERWREIEGPTTLWVSHSLVPALAGLFPPLPPSVGAAVDWELSFYPQATAAKLEARRARGETLPALEPTRRTRRLVLERWVTVDGGPAAVLEATWHVSSDVGGPALLRRGERWRGRWLVLATGRLLHAGLVANTWNESEVALGDPRDKVGTATIELRLVEACDGPTLPPFDDR